MHSVGLFLFCIRRCTTAEDVLTGLKRPIQLLTERDTPDEIAEGESIITHQLRHVHNVQMKSTIRLEKASNEGGRPTSDEHEHRPVETEYRPAMQ